MASHEGPRRRPVTPRPGRPGNPVVSERSCASAPVSRVLRFPSAIPRDAAIDAWFDDGRSRPDLRAIARGWFLRMRECGPDVRELLHDGHPTACVGDAAFAYTNVFTSHVNVGFFRGATLPDPSGLLQGSGKYMRHVKLKPDTAVAASSLEALITAAYLDLKRRTDTHE